MINKIISSCFMFIILISCEDAPTTTPPEEIIDSVTDIDGNVYQTVKIGNQLWMAENLKVTKYRNGDVIPNVTDDSDWRGLSSGAYVSYENEESNIAIYGLYYNWYAVNDNRSIAPEGWHVASDEDWKELEMHLGMSQLDADGTGSSGNGFRGTDEGGKIKETGTTTWSLPNTGATNESGFTALAGGYRSHNRGFDDLGNYAKFWTSTPVTGGTTAWLRRLKTIYSDISRWINVKQYGFNVRCVKD